MSTLDASRHPLRARLRDAIRAGVVFATMADSAYAGTLL